jgi:hypothetical protein
VIGVFVWSIILESLIGGLFTSIRPYLPDTAATSLPGTALGAAGFGPLTRGRQRHAAAVRGRDRAPDRPDLVLALAADRTTVRRDIA